LRVIVAGSRDISPSVEMMDYFIREAEKEIGEMTVLVCGMARGVDTAALRWREWYNRNNRHSIGIAKYPAKWDVAEAIYGSRNAAGPMRNIEMAENADALILIWDGVSKGSASMKKEALKRGLIVFEIIKNK
jgi:hypothetical protein